MSDATPIRGGGLLLLLLCPALAVSDTVVNALGIGMLLLVGGSVAAAVFAVVRRFLTSDVELAGAALISAAVFSALELLLRAYYHELYSHIAVFAPLASLNCVLIGAAALLPANEGAALRNAVKAGASAALLLLALGVARELVGRGSILHGAGAALGSWAAGFEAKVFSVDMGFLLGMLPPGAFIALGLLIALRNWMGERG